jgi:cytochrome c biogenesis protein CcmG/thiol:disulfide interchange protein DsbE
MSEATAGAPLGRRLLYLMPVLLFAVVAGYFLWGLDSERDPRAVPSVMIDKPVPEFDLLTIQGMDDPGLAAADLRGQGVTLVNFFASWCIPCRAEHPVLERMVRDRGVRLVGINYKDKPGDARSWLAELGNPFARIGADESGRVAIDWGVYGVPETFIVDDAGRIRYRHLGPLTPDAVEEIVMPLVRELGS